MRTAIALLAVAVLPHTVSTASPHANPSCTAKTFRVFSAKVWRPGRWQRGMPPRNVIRAERHRLACAGPQNRRTMQARWRRDKNRYFVHRRYCGSGPVFAGRVSTFGPPGEAAGITASGVSSAEPGIALRSSSTLGATFLVTVDGRSAYLRQTDWGPASWTGRSIDVTGAGVAALGGLVTDSYGTARLIPSGC